MIGGGIPPRRDTTVSYFCIQDNVKLGEEPALQRRSPQSCRQQLQFLFRAGH
jgi:hypothetical protein